MMKANIGAVICLFYIASLTLISAVAMVGAQVANDPKRLMIWLLIAVVVNITSFVCMFTLVRSIK